MNTERLKDIKTRKLDSGSHTSLESGACIMELVSYVAGLPWSDHPSCTCPILTEYVIRLNDNFSDKDRQLLKPFINKLIGTNSSVEIRIARKRLIRWRYVTVTYPLLLEFIKLPVLAKKLRRFKNNLTDMARAVSLLKENKETINKAFNAYAYAYAYADAYAYTYADAYADADAYAYAYAYAYALRSKLVKVYIQTLKLATKVK